MLVKRRVNGLTKTCFLDTDLVVCKKEDLAMKAIKRWKAIIIGFVFLLASQMVEIIFDNITLQIVLNTIFVIGALISFIISVSSDSKLKIKEIVKNKWIMSSLILCTILLVIILITRIK